MTGRKGFGISLLLLGVFLLLFQAAFIGFAAPRGYSLIYEWIFYAINYAIIFSVFTGIVLLFQGALVKWIAGVAVLGLLAVNSLYFYTEGDVNVLVARSDNGEHEVIFKEFKRIDRETVRLKRRGGIFGREVAVLEGSASYKALEEGQYKLEWPVADTAALTYQTDGDESLAQQLVHFRSSDYISYKYVAVGLLGDWVQQDDPQHTFSSDNKEFVYRRDGETTVFDIFDTEQFGIYSLVMEDAEGSPVLTIIMNPGTEFDEDGIIKEDGTITIAPVSLEKTESAVFVRE